MNFKQFGSLLSDNPLCGIGTYKDELNLATGACTRQIKKLVLTGQENITKESGNAVWKIPAPGLKLPGTQSIYWLCSHYESVSNSASWTTYDYCISWSGTDTYALRIRDKNYPWSATLESFKQYLTDQYAAGTPVTIWYVLATPTTETITVPSGLSGTVEGYLNRSGTPTPDNPIYPTANTVEQWFDLNHYIMGTSTDTITTLPAIIYPLTQTATLGLKGNAAQNGTPTPDNPVMPEGTGDKTANLFDKSTATLGKAMYQNGENVSSSFGHSDYISVNAETQYYLSNVVPVTQFYTCCAYDSAKQFLSYCNLNATAGAITTPQNCKYIIINFIVGKIDDIMVNAGSTALPYEPYGNKIPILSAGQTTPVYLGDVQSTRRIKKLVLDGTEAGWNVATSTTESSTYVFSIRYDAIGMDDIINYDKNMLQIPYPQFYSTHFKLKTNTSADNSYRDINNGEIGANSIISSAWNYNRYIIFATNQCDTVNDFIQFLAAQYAAGTPVTIWYVLATETTGIVNEPIMKIGDYADSISGISIPTITGANTLDVDTTVAPSEVTATFNGWHPVSSAHERDNGAWT